MSSATDRYLKIGDRVRIRHPRAGGGPLKALGNMDSRLRGNDALQGGNRGTFKIGFKNKAL
jgi:hypothetical protein